MVAGACPPTAPWKEQKNENWTILYRRDRQKEEDISAKKKQPSVNAPEAPPAYPAVACVGFENNDFESDDFFIDDFNETNDLDSDD